MTARACCAVVAFLAACALAATPPRAVLPESEHDFGTVREGEVIRRDFAIHNAGDEPLRIESVEFSRSGLTSRVKPRIEPRQTGSIAVEWDTQGWKGEANAEVTIRWNDPTTPFAILRLRVMIQPPVDLLPHGAVFLSRYRDQATTAVLTIVNHEQRQLSIENLQTTGPHFVARLEREKPGQVYRIVVGIPSDVAPGKYEDSLTFSTNSPSAPRFEVPVHLFVMPELFASPESIDFGDVPLSALRDAGAASVFGKTILLTGREPFRIESTQGPPRLTIAVTPSEGTSRVFRVEVGLSLKDVGDGPLGGSIRIRTSGSPVAVVSVPVAGAIKR